MFFPKGITLTTSCLLLLAAGCGGGGGKENPPPTCTEDNSLCARVLVPAGFAGEAVNLTALFFTSPQPAGMPAAILAQIPEPDIGPSRPYDLVLENVNAAQGTYYFFVVLYMPGGGTAMPVAGVDYLCKADQAVEGDGKAKNVGEIPLTSLPDGLSWALETWPVSAPFSSTWTARWSTPARTSPLR